MTNAKNVRARGGEKGFDDDGTSLAGVSAKDAQPSIIDDLWASMNADRGDSRATSNTSKRDSGGGGLDVKALLRKAGAGSIGTSGTISGSGSGSVRIKQVVEFCGEEVVVEKMVKEGSKEELAYRHQLLGSQHSASIDSAKSVVADSIAASVELQEQMHASVATTRHLGRGFSSGSGSSSAAQPVRFDSNLEFKAAFPPPKLPGAQPKPTGLQGLLASIDGKKKLTTMEKSRHDWGQYKDSVDDQTRDEMERFAKDGYLAKQAFLARTDARQAEVARSNRRRGMGLRDYGKP